ncbi:MAG: four helix bundle protein [Acidobacteria bacterium]|nr:four helix bundle protein [Acidobacteriota bacterium]
MKNYKELEVWQKAKGFAVEMYRVTESFPRTEQFGLTSQIRRAATSIAANIAEGWGRGTTGEYIHFLMIARGSSMEVETHLIIAAELGYLNEKPLDEFQERIQRIGQMLNRLIQVLKGRETTRGGRSAKPEPRTPNPESRS